MITTAAEMLRERYPAMFKPSHACRPPHLNVDVLREEVHKADVLSRFQVRRWAALSSQLEQKPQRAKRPSSAELAH